VSELLRTQQIKASETRDSGHCWLAPVAGWTSRRCCLSGLEQLAESLAGAAGQGSCNWEAAQAGDGELNGKLLTICRKLGAGGGRQPAAAAGVGGGTGLVPLGLGAGTSTLLQLQLLLVVVLLAGWTPGVLLLPLCCCCCCCCWGPCGSGKGQGRQGCCCSGA